MSELPIKKAFPFIPWGALNVEFTEDLPRPLRAPEDWDPDGADRPGSFQKWFDETVVLIADTIWPQYIPAKAAWVGAAADVKKMEELTNADLDLIIAIRERNLIDGLPTTNLLARGNGDAGCPPHSTWFSEEDKVNSFAAKHKLYDYNTTEARSRLMKESYFRDHFAKESGFVSTMIKQRLQRPRPYQMAVSFGKTNFTWLHAASADSPSACSGHSLQGLCAVGGIIETLLLKKVHLADDSWDAIEQYGVDIGDRRVMAGVHYPSDNLISWLILLSFADHVYRDSQVKQRLYHAITKRSIVYQEMLHSGKYDVLLKLLDDLIPQTTFI